MALILSLLTLAGSALLIFIFAAFGQRILRWLRVELRHDLEQSLCAAAVGAIAYEALVSLAQFTGHMKAGIYLALVVAASFLPFEGKELAGKSLGILRRVRAGSRREHLLAGLTSAVLAVEGLAAVAPLTGSDALHYHFPAMQTMLEPGFHPNFFLVHGFLTGQGHLLIATGLVLWGAGLSLALIFAAGVLASGAAACLARRMASRELSWLCGLTFLLTPVVFWQISGSGCPDIWMALFAALGVLVISKKNTVSATGFSVLVGMLCGATAGAKYTGCIVAASLLLGYLLQTRSVKNLEFLSAGCFFAGIWPYARNVWWAGDPVFPYLAQKLASENFNAFASQVFRAETGASRHLNWMHLLGFPSFAVVDQTHLGFWQFFGPLCLCALPLIFKEVKNSALWTTSLVAWIVASVAIGALSGMMRFLLPVFPIALAASLWGVLSLDRSWRFTRFAAIASVCAFLALGLAGLLFKQRWQILEAAGFMDRERFLLQQAPDYGKSQFINRALSGHTGEGTAMVFLRHTYYLSIPYLNGDPSSNWALNPASFHSKDDWRKFFRAQKIRWVVRSPDYPPVLQGPLQEMEKDGELVPFAQGVADDFSGMRLEGARVAAPIAIFRVEQ